MWKLIARSPNALFPRNAIVAPNSRSDFLYFCTSQFDPVQRIADILAKLNDWKPLLETSDFTNSLSPEVVRSVIRNHSAIGSKTLAEFFLWSETKLGSSKDLGLFSSLVVSLCNSEHYSVTRKVIDLKIRAWKNPLDVLDCVVKCFWEVDSGKALNSLVVATNPTSNPLCFFCTSQETLEPEPDPVRRIADILAQTKHWKPLLETSDIPRSLCPDVVRSVIRNHGAIEPRRLVDFFFWYEAKLGLYKDLSLYSLLAVSLCNSGSYFPARNVIDRMIRVWKNPLTVLGCLVRCFSEVDSGKASYVVFEMLVDRYRNLGLVVEACEVFLGLKSVAEFRPNLILCNSLLRDLLRTNNVAMFWKVCDEMSEMKIDFDEHTYSSVIMAHFRSGNVRGARKVFFEMGKKGCSPNVVIYTLMIDGFCRAGLLQEAVKMKDLMVRKSLAPNKLTYTTLAKVYCKAKRLADAKLVLSEMVDAGLEPDSVAYNTLIDGFVKRGRLKEAFDIKDEMVTCGVPVDLFSYNALLSGVCEAGKKMDKAREIVYEMTRTGNKPDSKTYTLLIEGYCREHDLDSAFKVFDEMKRLNMAPSTVTYGVVINGLCMVGDFERANNLIGDMISCGLKPNFSVYHPIISNYLKKGKLKETKRVLDRMREQGVSPDLDTYIYLIIGLCNANDLEEAKAYFDEFLAKGFQPHAGVYGAFIRAYCMVGNMPMADRCFDEMVASRLVPNQLIYKTLIGRHCNDGNLEQAFLVFRRMLECGNLLHVRTYGLFINALSRCGKTQEALGILSELCEKGLSPDVYVYNALIYGLFTQGDPDRAIQLHDEMCAKGISPNAKTYNTLIDGLRKAGDAEKAENFEKAKNLTPKGRTCATMLVASCEEGDVTAALKSREDIKGFSDGSSIVEA